jgi:SLOG cluster2
MSLDVTEKTSRPLVGCIVGISISETEEMASHGFDSSEVNRCVVRLAEALLGAGARLAFGHDWRPGGVMEAVAALAVRYFGVIPDIEGANQTQSPLPPIINRVAPPDVPFLQRYEPTTHQSPIEGETVDRAASRMARMLRGIVEARQANPPEGPANAATSRADALSAMRWELANLCDARVCLGGRLTNFSGARPGVIEEALYTLELKKPVYASAIFGGASRLVVEALASVTPGPNPILGPEAETVDEKRTYIELIRRAAAKANVSRELPSDEEKQLWESKSVEFCVELILRGIARWWRQHHHSTGSV